MALRSNREIKIMLQKVKIMKKSGFLSNIELGRENDLQQNCKKPIRLKIKGFIGTNTSWI